MTNREVVENYDKLYKLMLDSDIKLSALASYSVVRNLRTMQPIVEDYFMALHKIFDLYANPIESTPGMFRAKEGMEDKLDAELKALDNIDNDITVWMITMRDLADARLSLNDMDALYFMLDGEV